MKPLPTNRPTEWTGRPSRSHLPIDCFIAVLWWPVAQISEETRNNIVVFPSFSSTCFLCRIPMKDVSVTLIPLRHTMHHDKIDGGGGGGGSGDSKKVSAIKFDCCIVTAVRKWKCQSQLQFLIAMLLSILKRSKSQEKRSSRRKSIEYLLRR